MKDESMKKQNFLQGAAILAAATLIVKLLGFLFKTPLNYIIGETGSSYFYNAYRVYDVLLMISTTGLPVAMSRMISEAQTLGNHAQIRKIYKTALYVFLTIGIVGSLGMFLFSKPLSVLVSNSENELGGHCGPGSVRAHHLHDLGVQRLLPGPEQHGPDVHQPDLRGHHPPRHRPEPRVAAHA